MSRCKYCGGDDHSSVQCTDPPPFDRDEEATELALTLEAIRGKDGFFFVGHPLDIARNILAERADQ